MVKREQKQGQVKLRGGRAVVAMLTDVWEGTARVQWLSEGGTSRLDIVSWCRARGKAQCGRIKESLGGL